MPDDDRDLAQRLRAYESRLPDADAPDPRAIRPRGDRRLPVVAGVLSAAAVMGVVGGALLLNGQSSRVGEATTPPSPTATPSGVEALPLHTPRRGCLGDQDVLRAIYRIPNGDAFWTVFPEAGLAPELTDVNQPLLVVVYDGIWPGMSTGVIGRSPRESPAPGTSDVCVETVDGSDAIAGASFAVYGDIPLASSMVATTPPSPVPSPASTVGQSSGWSIQAVAPAGAPINLGGIAEVRGSLYAFGNDGHGGPAIFSSSDGLSWTAANVPPFDPEVGGSVGSLVDAGERLVALAQHGAPGGSGPVGTVVYVSDDGSVWTEVDVAGIDVPPLSDVVVMTDRIVAAGRGVWISDDGGLTWAESAAFEDMEGGVYSLVGHGDLLIGAGQVGYDIPGPTALAWVSRDRGVSWERDELSDEAGAWAVATSSSGHTAVVGGGIWISEDEGRSWRQVPSPVSGCCVYRITAGPTGFVGVGSTEDGRRILLSGDGDEWHAETVSFEPRDIAWGPSFGLVAVTGDAVVFGPDQAP